MKKYTPFIEGLAIIIGIILILLGFNNDPTYFNNRTTYIGLGVFIISLAIFASLRNAIFSFAFLYAGFSSLGSVFNADGMIDIAWLIMVILFFSIAAYFIDQLIHNFPPVLTEFLTATFHSTKEALHRTSNKINSKLHQAHACKKILDATDPASSDDIIVTTQKDLQSFMFSHTLVDTIRTKVVGVTFKNDDGTSRQDILALCSAGDEVALQYYEYRGAPAYAVVCWHGRIGSLSADIARGIDAAYNGAIVKCSISAITGGFDSYPLGCNLIIEVYKENSMSDDNDEKATNRGYISCSPNPAKKNEQPAVDDSFVAEAQWYAARGGVDLIDDE